MCCRTQNPKMPELSPTVACCNEFGSLQIEKYDLEIELLVCLVFNSECTCMGVAVERGGLSEAEAQSVV